MRSSFINCDPWPDNNGVHINAHGGGILYHNGSYYWYGEHKIAGEAGNRAQVGVHVYSSSDLYNWTDEGIALEVVDDPESPITRGCVLERPKVIYNANTRMFVMWFHLELKGQGYKSALAATAISDSPTGPFRFLEAFRLNAGIWPLNVTERDKIPGEDNFLLRDFERGQMSRDMTLFVDEDGSAYHITSSEENSTCHISLLSDDYLKPSGKYVRIFPKRWMEAHAICKRNGRYYYLGSGCTGWAPNAARAAVAEHIFGPWEEVGNPCEGINPWNNLGPELTFGGQSTFILPVEGTDTCIAMFDIWRPENAIDGRYLWLPMEFTTNGYRIPFHSEWSY
ncbi:MAG: beta-glucanase [Lentisphaerae bacterium]|nr:MAG: beta-glucanase [Lentisphaerota bacterium]